MKNDRQPQPAEAPGWLQFLNLGWTFALTMVIAIMAGRWLDKHFFSQPLFLILCLLLGFLASGFFFYRIIQKLNLKDVNTFKK